MQRAAPESTIEDYFLIGDLYSAALVSKEGSIDWLCLPYFESSSLFARLLDAGGGSFSIDTAGYVVACHYIRDTAIVERTLTKAGTEVVIRDFMVPCDGTRTDSPQYLVRKIIGQEGEADIIFLFDPRPQYAGVQPDVEEHDGKLTLHIEGYRLTLHLPPDAQATQTEGG